MPFFKKHLFIEPRSAEKVLLVIRRHWFDIFIQLFQIFVLAALLFGSYTVIPAVFPVVNGPLLNDFFMFMETLFAMFIWILFFLIWIDYYFDVWIITNKRVIDVKQNGLFSRNVSELKLEKIQDVTTEVRGVIPTFLNYGEVYVQTAGEKERFRMHNIPDPYAVKDLIMKLQGKVEIEKTDELGEMIEEKIRDGMN